MLTTVAVRRDVIDPNLFDFDPLGQLLPDRPSGNAYQFWFHDPCPLLPVLHKGRIILARWGCRRGECCALPWTGWTSMGGDASRFWREVGGVMVAVPAYLGYKNGAWVPLRAQVRAVLAYDARGQPHAFVVCEPESNEVNLTENSEPVPSLATGPAWG